MTTENYKYAIPFLVFAGFFVFFLHCAAPSVYWYDEGELITALHRMGLPHSPSFPLFINLVKPIALLPAGSTAFRANAVSGLMSALALVMLLMIMFRIRNTITGDTRRSFILFITCLPALLFLCGTDIWWFQSIRVEVYTLNALLSVLVIYFILSRQVSLKKLLAVSAIFGFGLANHPLLFIHIFPACFLYLALEYYKNARMLKYLPVMTVFAVLGLSVYLYLPVRSSLNPIPDLGDPQNYEGFILSLFRTRSYGKFFGNTWTQMMDSFRVFLPRFTEQFSPMGAAFIVLGFLGLLKNKPKYAMLLSLVIAVNTGMALMNKNFTDNPDTMDAYFMNTYQFSAVFLGLGIILILDLLLKLSKYAGKNTLTALKYLLIVITFGVAILNLNTRFDANNLRNDNFAVLFGKTLLDLAAPDSILFTGYYTNTHFILMEMVYAEKYREDVAVIDRIAIRNWHRYDNSMKQLYPHLVYPVLYLNDISVDSSKHSSLYDVLQNRDKLYELLTQYTFMLAELNMKNYPVYWMSSDDDYLFFQRLLPRGPVFQLTSQPINQISKMNEYIDLSIYKSMELNYLSNSLFKNNYTAPAMIATQFHNMATSFSKSGNLHWAQIESQRASSIYSNTNE